MTHVNCFIVDGVYLGWKDNINEYHFVGDVIFEECIELFEECHLYAKHFNRLSCFNNINEGNAVLKKSICEGVQQLYT